VPAGDLPVAGTGAALYPDAFPNRISPEYPDAGVLAALVVEQLSAVETAGIVGGLAGAVGAASATELLPLEPLYLRRPDAREPGARKSVLRL
jgi:hypothetical protein